MARWFLLLLSGCSLSLSGPSPDRPRNKQPACDTSKAPVVIDALLAGTMAIVAVSVAGGSSGGDAAIAPVLVGGLFAASAVHGNNVVNACNREIGNYESESAQVEPPVAPLRRDEAPAVAMQPAVSVPMPSTALPSQQPQQPAPPQSQPQPPPEQQPQPEQPAQPAQPAADAPWSAFWKEVR